MEPILVLMERLSQRWTPTTQKVTVNTVQQSNASSSRAETLKLYLSVFF